MWILATVWIQGCHAGRANSEHTVPKDGMGSGRDVLKGDNPVEKLPPPTPITGETISKTTSGGIGV